MRAPYPTDLTDAQWRLIEPLLPARKRLGRRRTVDLREVLCAIFYLLRAGCSWRMLPHEFPPWSTAHYYYRRWRLDGVWPQIHDRLHQQARQAVGRETSPSAAIIDSQSVKTTEKGGNAATMRARRSRVASGISP